MPYSAFISYSHAADDKLAPAIQRALHAFANPWYKLRGLRVFRDKTSLSANPGLWTAIERALGESEWFLLMASPRAAQSHWVQQEIAWWIRERTSARMLILLTEGDLAWDPGAGDFDWNRTSALPITLKGQFSGEPLYVDLRWARAEEHVSLRNSQFRAAILDIAAPVRGVPKDELDGEDVRQHRRNKLWAWGAATALAALTAVSIVAAVVAVQQRDQAELRRQVAFSRQVAAQGLNHLGVEHLDAALLLALESRNVLTSPKATSIADTFESRSILLTALAHGAAPIVSFLHGGNLAAFSRDGKRLVSASADRIVVWDLATRQPVGRPLPSHGDAVFSLAVSPDGRLLASSSRSDNNVILWTLDTRAAEGPPLTAHGGSAVALTLSSDGTLMATGGGDKTVVLWDVHTRQPLGQPLQGHTSNVVSLAFSPDRKTLASGSWDGTVALWDVEGQVLLGAPLNSHVATGEPFGQVESVTFSPDGRRLAVGGGGGIVLWDVGTRAPIGKTMSHPGGVRSVAFSPDGTLLASGGGNSPGTVIVWNVDRQQPARPPLRGHASGLDSVEFSPDGKTLVSGGDDGTMILWDLSSLHRLATKLSPQKESTDGVAMSRNGAVVAMGICLDVDGATRQRGQCREGGIRLLTGASRSQARVLRTGHPGTPTSLMFLSDTTTLVSSSCSRVNGSDCSGIEVQFWNTATGGAQKHSIADERTRVDSMAVSPDGKIVAAAGAKEIRLFDVQTGRQLGTPLVGHDRNRNVDDLVFSPDGGTLVSTTLDDAIFWNVSTGKPRGQPVAGSSVAFTRDGKIAVIGGTPTSHPPKTITLRDTATARSIGELTIGDREVILRMAFSPDGTLLAVSSVGVQNDAPTITLWDVARRERLGSPLAWHGGRAFALAFSHDGKTLLAGIEDHGLVAWDVDGESWRRRACEIANRNLTFDEWTQLQGAEPYRPTCKDLPVDATLIEAGRRRARAGDVESAVAIFKRAKELNPKLELDAQKEATQSTVKELIANGRYLATAGDVEGGAAALERARKLDPSVRLDPAAEARKLAAPGLVEWGEQLTQAGRIGEAKATFSRAQTYDPALKIPAGAWNDLCRMGSLKGQAAEVMEACEKAVTLEPEHGPLRTSRGIARALVKKTDESIADFEAFLAWEKHFRESRRGFAIRNRLEAQRLRHQEWIAALRAGRNPFTPEELEAFLHEPPLR